jgi:CDP-paratose 2-epimerase
MKVLVTGGCGFLGSHVCEYYIQKGWDVVAYDNMTKLELKRTGYAAEGARDYNVKFLQKIGVEIVQQDVQDHETLLKTSEGCDYIIHTAAQPAMTISWEQPRLDFMTNVLGTFNVLEVARELEIPIVSCASVHIYGNAINEELTEGETRYLRDPAEIGEDYPLCGGNLSPLHASKVSGDYYVRTYADQYGVDAASFRLTGLYGVRQFGGEDHGWVANFAIRTAMDRPLRIFGTGKQTRDIIYATDVCEAFHAFFQTRKSGVYNIGGSNMTTISLLECIDLLGDISGKTPEVSMEPGRYGDLQYFVCDISRAKEALGWEPTITPREGVGKLYEWIDAEKDLFHVS